MAWGICLEKRLKTSNSQGKPAHRHSLYKTCLIISCLCLQWSPGRPVDWMLSPYRSTFFLPLTVSPTKSEQAGLGRHRLAAAASLNSALVRDESAPGKANSQAEEILSLCFHARTGLAFLGWYNASALERSRARDFSLAPVFGAAALCMTKNDDFRSQPQK